MPVVKQFIQLIEEDSAVRLARYAQIVGYDENPFWGINHNVGDHACRTIWNLSQRMMVAKYLGEAQTEIEHEISYPIGTRWLVEDKRRYKCPAFTHWGHVIEMGIKKVVTIASNSAISVMADPATIGPVLTTVTDPGEIHIFHHGTNVEIDPSEITISGGQVTILVPWCRLVKLAFVDNPDVGWNYADVGTWGESAVDIRRVYNDDSVQVNLLTNHKCNDECCESGCKEYTHSACGYIHHPELGIVEIIPSNYLGGVWINNCGCRYKFHLMQLNYHAGVEITKQMEDMIVRLGHAKMPKEPCGCDLMKNLWDRDRKEPDVYSRERINCPFGTSMGAWTAWKWAETLKLVRGGIVG